MVTTMCPWCLNCKNYIGFQSAAEELSYEERFKRLGEITGYCKAFPKGTWIPKEIWWGDNPHTAPYPGDNGIQYEPSDE